MSGSKEMHRIDEMAIGRFYIVLFALRGLFHEARSINQC